ncbi:MAG: pitrilysin family protein [Candidatus Eisenbacteria bacterium]
MSRLRAAVAALLSLALGLAVFAAPAAVAAPAADVKASRYVVPKALERQLRNGMKVLILEDDRLPLVHYRFMVRVGAADEPAEKAGVANLTLQTLRQGAGVLDAKAISERLDGLGADYGAVATRDYCAITAQFLAKDWMGGLELLAGIVREPTFPKEEVERQRSQVLAQVQQSRDQNAVIASEHVAALVYGEHPYARPVLGDAGSLQSITRDDIVRFHQAYFRSNLCLLVVAGDVVPDQVVAAVEARFADMGPGEAPARKSGELPAFDTNRVRLLDKPQVTQTELRLGFPGTSRRSPDFYALQVMNYVLGGGGFSSRLLENARSKGGLTYSANTTFDFGQDTGAFYASTFTRNASVGPMVDLMLATIGDYRAAGPSEKEVADAKRFFIGALPFGVQTAEGLAAQWAAIDLYDLGADYFERYAERLGAITPAIARAAAEKYLRTEKLAIVAVGTADSIKASLDKFGPIEVLDYRSPTGAVPVSKPAESLPAETFAPAALAKAAPIVARALAAHGGAAKLKAVKDLSSRSAVTVTAPTGPVEGEVAVVVRLPDRTRIEMSMLGQSGVQVLNGRQAWASNGTQVSDLSGEQTQAMQAGIRTQVLPFLQRLARGAAQAAWSEEEAIGGEAVDVLQVADEGTSVRASFGRKTGLLLRLEQEEPAMFGGGKVPMARLYSDFRAVDGFTVPFRTERLARGTRLIEDRMTSFQVNRGVTDSQFQRPAR